MPFEYFEASDIVTVAIMAPARTRQALDNSGDELYDLCHPKKVVLLSREESNAPVVQHPPEEGQVDKQEQTPAYLERSAHRDGQIIITADYTGSIKVFRQYVTSDCIAFTGCCFSILTFFAGIVLTNSEINGTTLFPRKFSVEQTVFALERQTALAEVPFLPLT